MRYLIASAENGDFDGKDLGMIFSALLAVIRAFDRVSGAPRRVPSMEHVLEELIGRPLPSLHRMNPCPCGSGRRYRDCCLKKRSSLASRSRAPLP
jgi:SEC-C motif